MNFCEKCNSWVYEDEYDREYEACVHCLERREGR